MKSLLIVLACIQLSVIVVAVVVLFGLMRADDAAAWKEKWKEKWDEDTASLAEDLDKRDRQVTELELKKQEMEILLQAAEQAAEHHAPENSYPDEQIENLAPARTQ